MRLQKIAIIGCGNLGFSILRGIMDSNKLAPENLIVTKRNIESLQSLRTQGVTVTNDNITAIRCADIVIFALKPYNILKVIGDLAPHCIAEKHVLISVATGISISQIQKAIQKPIPIFRAMPNTAADVKESMTCFCSHSSASVHLTDVESIFQLIGDTIVIDEALMDAATVLGSCGVAYVMRFIRAMVQGGVQIGFSSQMASQIVNQTVQGASKLLIERKQHAEAEIDKVTTPKGCTIVGLNEMEHGGFSSSLIKGIVASFEKIDKDTQKK